MTRSEAVLPETVQTAGVVETKLTAQPGMAEAIEIQRQAGHAIYADHLSAMLYGTGLNPAHS